MAAQSNTNIFKLRGKDHLLKNAKNLGNVLCKDKNVHRILAILIFTVAPVLYLAKNPLYCICKIALIVGTTDDFKENHHRPLSAWTQPFPTSTLCQVLQSSVCQNCQRPKSFFPQAVKLINSCRCTHTLLLLILYLWIYCICLYTNTEPQCHNATSCIRLCMIGAA